MHARDLDFRGTGSPLFVQLPLQRLHSEDQLLHFASTGHCLNIQSICILYCFPCVYLKVPLSSPWWWAQAFSSVEFPWQGWPPFCGGLHGLCLCINPGLSTPEMQVFVHGPKWLHSCHSPSTISWSCPSSDLPRSFSTKYEPK